MCFKMYMKTMFLNIECPCMTSPRPGACLFCYVLASAMFKITCGIKAYQTASKCISVSKCSKVYHTESISNCIQKSIPNCTKVYQKVSKYIKLYQPIKLSVYICIKLYQSVAKYIKRYQIISKSLNCISLIRFDTV